MLANNWMLKAFSQFKLDAANLGEPDLRFAREILAKDKYDNRVKETPAAGEFISANTVPAAVENAPLAPKPYVIREVTGKRFPNGKRTLKVGFIGLTEPGETGLPAFTVASPTEKLKAILPEVRKQADLVVVLAYMPQELTKQLAKENPDIDVILAAYNLPQPTAFREGKTIIAYAYQQTKSLGELRLYLGDDGKVSDYLNRYISLDSSIPDNKEAAQIMAASKSEVDAAKAKVDAAEAARAQATVGQPANVPAKPIGNAKIEPLTSEIIKAQQKKGK